MLFVREVLGAEPDEKQQRILRAIARRERRISIRSGHRVGKTTVLAWAMIWQILIRFPQKTIATAPTSSQLFDALASETKAWINKLPDELRATLDVKSDRIELLKAPEESFISFATSRAETPEALAGKHSKNVLLVADEASGIPEPVFEAAAGSMAGYNATTVLAGNPVRTSGLFFDTHHDLKDLWLTEHISCIGHPRITPDFVTDMARRYGERSNAFRVRVLGEFPLADDDKIIPFELLELAKDRDIKPTPFAPVVWGVDCARFGDDESALAKRKSNVLLEPVRTWLGLDTMELVGRVKGEWDSTQEHERPFEINVDVIGIGAGVCDRLRELGLPARGINVSETPALKGQHNNLRTELWFKGKDWFSARDCVANDTELLKELGAQTYEVLPSGKLAATGKREMKKKGVKSPNRGDAFLLTLASESIIALQGTKASSSWRKPLRRVIRGIV